MSVTQSSLNRSFSSMVLSASGWRKVFASSGDAEDFSPDITEEDRLICTACAEVFIKGLNLTADSSVFLARDARPTGAVICSVIAKVLSYYGIKVCYAGICSAPEAMAQSVYRPYSCFVYVSASHNPVGYNGIKVGKNGGVLSASEINPLIEMLKTSVTDVSALQRVYDSCCDIAVTEDSALKNECLENYGDFVRKTTCPNGDFSSFVSAVRSMNVGIVADLNGSARCLSIDKDFLASLGVKTCFINDVAGKIAHAIVPEGENLRDCCNLLEKMHASDSAYCIGYVPDNDGDRGNLVYMDKNNRAAILKAQDVFALCVYATLSFFRHSGFDGKLAVAVNCATSMRTDEIARRFSADVFRAEVGEANVVSLADDLRKRGYNVPILGEGANGGNITYPARVRDPMNTLMCMLRLMQEKSVASTLEQLPQYITTDAFSSDGVLHLSTDDFKSLKAEYEKAFPLEWERMKAELLSYGIVSCLEFQTEGIRERQEAGNGNKGGLKMVFYNAKSEPVAFIWMRPSGTEPLLRLLADVRGGDSELHDKLLSWQRAMILSAQQKILQA